MEFGVLAHSGKKSFAFPTSAIFQHLPMPFIYAGARQAQSAVSGRFCAATQKPRERGFAVIVKSGSKNPPNAGSQKLLACR
ncbi:MAG: hypothetical protein ABWZ39_08665, partial [Pseudomonas caspiana]